MDTKKTKDLPLSIQSFEKLITNNLLYVDKTEQIYKLAIKPYAYFLSRPRRFGKSLMCSTLQALFEGKRELFKGLWIENSDWQWQKHPVIHLSFNSISHETPDELKKGIFAALDTCAKNNGIVLEQDLIKEKFTELVEKLAKQNKNMKVVLIIDEYDKPILDHLSDYEMADKIRTILKGFYGTIKDLDPYLRFVFITGVTKFTKVSIFSELNQLQELSFDERAATLLGYTQQELKFYFSDYLGQLAKKLKIPLKELLDKMKNWYDGYCFFAGAEKVYNPFSVGKCLDRKLFDDYWFESGTPNFLITLIKTNNYDIPDLENVELGGAELTAFDIQNINLCTLLAQAGYLTINTFDEEENLYTLSYPNWEVRRALSSQIIELMTSISSKTFIRFVSKLKKALKINNFSSFCEILHEFFTHIPYTIHVKDEKYFQTIFFIVVKMMGLDTDVEVATNKGRIDAIIKTKTQILIIEFKVKDSSEKAIAQIEDREYRDKYQYEEKPITLVGIQFNLEEKNIDMKWLIKQLYNQPH